jgi:hypothetical protein
MIVKVGERWILYSKDGKTILGKHDTRAEAEEQERAIKASEAARARLKRKR